jgi:hypothetical protein
MNIKNTAEMITDEKVTTFIKEISQKKSAEKQAVKQEKYKKIESKKDISIIHK